MNILMLIVCLVIAAETKGARLRRLVGGYPIEIEKVPYQVSIRVDNYHICGGSLISERHVLTAAHCVAELFQEPYEELTVVTGTKSLVTGGTHHNVKNITWHHEFTDGLESVWNNDIAVLTLTANVEQNEKQKAIELPTENAPINVTGIISGFGRVETENPYLSVTLQGATTTILPIIECKKFINDRTIRETQICGKQKKGTGICKGDSGGPLVHDGKIIGIASWNIPCGRGIPDFYTNVYKYLDFIEETINGLVI